MRTLVVDNYDSFTYNLVQLLGALGQEVHVYRNDRITLGDIDYMAPDRIVISPGPGRPVNAGISCDVIRRFHSRIPILGVCLGHQCIGHVFGMNVVHATKPMHGKTSRVVHTGLDIYGDVDNPFEAMRYHSLMLLEEELPPELMIGSRSLDGILMGLRHRSSPLYGVQFHPESFLTPLGERIMRNFLEIYFGP